MRLPLSPAYLVAITALALLAGWSEPARADLQIVVREDANTVIFEASGTLDTTDAVHPDLLGGPANHGITTDDAGDLPWVIALDDREPHKFYAVDALDGPWAASLNGFDLASFSAGDALVLNAGIVPVPDGQGGFAFTPAGNDQIGVPDDYISGTALRAVMEIEGASFASLDLIPGVYRFALPNDMVTLYIGAPYPPPHPVDQALNACEDALDAAETEVTTLLDELALANAALADAESELADAEALLDDQLALEANTEHGLTAILELLSLPFGQRVDPRTDGAYASPTVNAVLDALLDPSGGNYKRND